MNTRGTLALGVGTALLHGWERPPGGSQAAQAPAAAREAGPDYFFPTGAGVLLFHVRPDRATDFEAVLARLRTVLDSATDPVRRQQAAGWRMFRSSEASSDEVLYVLILNPAIPGSR